MRLALELIMSYMYMPVNQDYRVRLLMDTFVYNLSFPLLIIQITTTIYY